MATDGNTPGTPFDAVILAGGQARRLGGVDKPGLRLGGSSLLDRVLAACADAGQRIVVGPPRPLATPGPPVTWTREEPPGGGPLPALAAGLHRVRADTVLLLAADLPFMDRATVRRLLAVPADTDGCLLVDATGREQPLAAAYLTTSLRRELAALVDDRADLAGLPLRRLVRRLTLHHVPDHHGTAFDCDTWDDVTAVRARIGED